MSANMQPRDSLILEDDTAPLGTGEIAAVDLGSNSFHLVIARVHGDELAILDREREQVQLARGLGKRGRLGKKARARALSCLRRFSQRLEAVPPEQIRAVGTNTLRAAEDAGDFLQAAHEALGHPVEVISGHEEARLIHLGVAHSLPDVPGRRLVVDIGGGSTECILGEGFEALDVHSLSVGCVRLTRRFFPRGEVSKSALEEARLASALEVRAIERGLRETGWTGAVGASGTIRAADSILRANGWSQSGLTAAGLTKLRKAVLAVDHVDQLKLKGLKAERAPVFPAGLAILTALFERLGIESMSVASGALREGVMYDLLGRIRHEDARERTIRNFQERHRVDLEQAARVEREALALLLHAPRAWGLDPTADGRVLMWAARLHEIGLVVSYGKHHRHGGYLIAHADMPGFSRGEQALLAAIVANHRRKIDPALLDTIPADQRQRAVHLVLLLRLAVLLHRSRNPEPLPPFRLEEAGGHLSLLSRRGWLAEHPLTWRDLQNESAWLRALGLELDPGPLHP